MSRVSRDASAVTQASASCVTCVATFLSEMTDSTSWRGMRRTSVPVLPDARNPEFCTRPVFMPKKAWPGFSVKKWLRAPRGRPSFTVTVKISMVPETT